jgi:hypothetical protein
MLVVPQSFGDLLLPHPHAHALCSLGLFSHDGTFLPMEDLDFSDLEEIFRERFLDLMLRRGKILPETAERMRAWEHSGFNLGWERRLEREDRQGLQGLLSYMERSPVSLKRLTYRDDGMVHYQGTKVHPRLGVDHQLLPPVDFLALLVPHILLRYQVSSRLYGVISTRSRKRLGWVERPPTRTPPPEYGPAPLFASPPPPSHAPCRARGPSQRSLASSDDDSPYLKERRRSWARLMHRTWLCDPELCPVCGARMKVIAALSSPAQDDIIEKILRHIGRWDPPWKRARSARGPPARRPPIAPSGEQDLEATATIDPQWGFETYIVDPPAPEDP